MNVLNEKVKMVPVGQLKTHPRNPRLGDLEAIRESIRVNGFYGTVVVQKSTGFILVGNHRYMAASAEGFEQVPVAYVDVDDETAVRILMADNRTGDRGTYDDHSLVQLLQEIRDTDRGFRGTGYDDLALADLMNRLGMNVNPPDGTDDPDETEGEHPERKGGGQVDVYRVTVQVQLDHKNVNRVRDHLRKIQKLGGTVTPRGDAGEWMDPEMDDVLKP